MLQSLCLLYWKIFIRSWTKEKESLLRDIFTNTTDREIATQLNLTEKQVQSKARCLGLKKSLEHRVKMQRLNAENIASGPQRNQFKKNDPAIFCATGKNHPRYIVDRSRMKHRKNRFSVITMRATRLSQKDRCNVCDKPLCQEGEFDHIVPVCIDGTDSIDNCQLLCKDCHTEKTRYEQQISNNFLDLSKLKNNVT